MRSSWLVVPLALALAGCATARTRTVDLSYAPAGPGGTSGAATPAASVTVSTFVDARDKRDRIGTLKDNDEGEIRFVPARDLTQAVTDAVAARLTAEGYRVTRLGAPWDPRGGTIPSADTDLVVGGVIEEFYGESDGSYVWAPSNAEVRLRVGVAAPGERRMVGLSEIRSGLGGVTASRGLEPNLVERFRAAIDQVPLAAGLDTGRSGVAK
jgi:hypothetical protein